MFNKETKKTVSPEKKKVNTALSESDSYRYSDEFHYYFSADNPTITEFQRDLRSRQYSIGYVGVSPRNLNHWTAQGLVPSSIKSEAKGWHRFSLIDSFWLKAVYTMRDFGLSIPKIRKVKQAVFSEGRADTGRLLEYNIAKATCQPDDLYLAIKQDGEIATLSTTELEVVKRMQTRNNLLLISFKTLLSSLDVKVVELQALESKKSNYLRNLQEAIQEYQISKSKLPNYE